MADSTRFKYYPTGVRIGTDLISIVKSRSSETFKGWEVNADIDFYRYYFAVDFGSWSTHYNLRNGIYDSDGRYFRMGGDVNFLLKDPEKNMFFLGLRYGRTSFSDRVTYAASSSYFGDVSTSASNAALHASWKELTTGLRVKVWKMIWLGAMARVKFGLYIDGEKDLQSYDVPGFGLTFKPIWWGINYQLLVRIPIRKQK